MTVAGTSRISDQAMARGWYSRRFCGHSVDVEAKLLAGEESTRQVEALRHKHSIL